MPVPSREKRSKRVKLSPAVHGTFKSEAVNPFDSNGSEALIGIVATHGQSMQSINYLKERGQ